MCFISYLFKYFYRSRINTKLSLEDTPFSSVRGTDAINESIAALKVIVRKATAIPPRSHYCRRRPLHRLLDYLFIYRKSVVSPLSISLTSLCRWRAKSFSITVTDAADLLTRSVICSYCWITDFSTNTNIFVCPREKPTSLKSISFPTFLDKNLVYHVVLYSV